MSKVSNMQGYCRLNPTIWSDTYNISLHVSVFMAIVRLDRVTDEKKLHNITCYSTNISVV